MKFAFLILGDFDSCWDRALIHNGDAQIIGVSSLEDACLWAKELCRQGVDCIELCGAFEEAGARQVIAATENQVPVGYVVHLPEQDSLFTALFGEKEAQP